MNLRVEWVSASVKRKWSSQTCRNKLMSQGLSFSINDSFSCQHTANKLLSAPTAATIQIPKSLNIYHWLPVLNLDPVHFSGIASLCEFSAFLTACKIPLLSLTVSSLSSSSLLSEIHYETTRVLYPRRTRSRISCPIRGYPFICVCYTASSPSE